VGNSSRVPERPAHKRSGSTQPGVTESFALSLKGLNWATARDSKEIMICITAGQGTRVNDTEGLLAHLCTEENGGKRFSAHAVILQSGR
jgi:hypothetical protein